MYQALACPPRDGQEAWELRGLAAALRLSVSKVQVVLALLRDAGVVRAGRGAAVSLGLRQVGLEADAIDRLVEGYTARRQRDADAIEAMVDYAQSGHCRWVQVLGWLSDARPTGWACGHCDNCGRIAEAQRAVAGGAG